MQRFFPILFHVVIFLLLFVSLSEFQSVRDREARAGCGARAGRSAVFSPRLYSPGQLPPGRPLTAHHRLLVPAEQLGWSAAEGSAAFCHVYPSETFLRSDFRACVQVLHLIRSSGDAICFGNGDGGGCGVQKRTSTRLPDLHGSAELRQGVYGDSISCESNK